MKSLKFCLVVLSFICLLTVYTISPHLIIPVGSITVDSKDGFSGIVQFPASPASVSMRVKMKVDQVYPLHNEATSEGHLQDTSQTPSTGPLRTTQPPEVPPPTIQGGSEGVVEYHNISGTSPFMLSRLHKLHWTSLYGKQENDSYHFMSAYYDNRKGAPKRPAVLVLGYVFASVPNVTFYCVFTDSSGSKRCIKTPAYRQHPADCYSPVHRAKIFEFFCEIGVGEEPPVSVQLSTSNSCDPKLFSGGIPVKNRNASMTQKAPKKFGMCVGGPLVQKGNKSLFFRDVVEFVEMSKLMGVELIVLYVNETRVDLDILQYIWTHYPDTVRTIGWRKYQESYPLHYYGQILIISDCFYRIMYEVEYVAQNDIDELIIPVKTDNWSDKVARFRRNKHTASFKFQNNFFTEPSPAQRENLPDFCPNTPVPKYFTRTKRYKCLPGFRYRPKLMSRPKYILEPSIHCICKMLPGYNKTYYVPVDIAVLGHYRTEVPKKCAENSTTVSDRTALRFLDRLRTEMCP